MAMDPKLAETIFGPLLTAVAGYLLGILNTRRALAVEYDKELREKRLTTYAEIWQSLEPFALYSPRSDLEYGDLESIGARLREWYFTPGGLLLSAEARDQYFVLQDDIVKVLRTFKTVDARGGEGKPEGMEDWRRVKLRDHDELLTRGEADDQGLAPWVPAEDPKGDYLHLRGVASLLRTRLSDDLGTRRPPLLGRRSRGS